MFAGIFILFISRCFADQQYYFQVDSFKISEEVFKSPFTAESKLYCVEGCLETTHRTMLFDYQRKLCSCVDLINIDEVIEGLHIIVIQREGEG